MDTNTQSTYQDEYTLALAQGRNRFLQSALALVIAVPALALGLVVIVGVPSTTNPDPLSMFGAGFGALKKVVPADWGVMI